MNNIDKLCKPFAILSAELKGADNNVFRSLELKTLLEESGLRFKPVQGCYKGILEDSFYVELDSQDDINTVYTLANYFGQESFLLVNDQRTAILYSCSDQNPTKLGKFTQVSEFIAKTEESYTYDIVNNGYYICK